MLVVIALSSVLLGAPAHATPPLPPVCLEKPPVPATIEGQIISRDGAPVANVEVRGLVGEDHREYRTASDRQGRFVLTGFEAGSEVALTFRDAPKHVAVGCSVRPTAREPSMSVDVTLGAGGAPEDDVSLGCRSKHVDRSWIGGDGVQPLRNSSGPAADVDALPRLSLRSSDLAKVSMMEDGALLWLTPSGAEALTAFTEANVGRMTLTTIDGEPALRVAVQGTNSSGTMQVPEGFLRGKALCEILSRASRR